MRVGFGPYPLTGRVVINTTLAGQRDGRGEEARCEAR